MQAARRLLCLAGTPAPLQRAINGSKTLKSLSPGSQLGGATPLNRALGTARALPQAAAVEPGPTPAAPASNGGPRATANAPTFQEAIASLQEYWAGVGCALWLPHTTEVGGRM